MTTTTTAPIRGRKQPIEVQSYSGPMTVDAIVYPRTSPVLAVHRSVGDRGIWRITHIPTGLRIVDAETQRHAKRIVEKLLPLDWGIATDSLFLSVADGKRRNKLRDQVREIIRVTP